MARRFGPDADTRWAQFAGALGLGDRLDIVLRDAAGTWGAAFSPSDCFGFFGLADDEPFGPDWGGLPDTAAKRLLGEADRSPTIESVAAALGVLAATVPLPPINPSTKIAVAGGAAVVAVAGAFERDQALSWTDQVVVLAEHGPTRQLAGLAAVIIGARARTVIVRPHADAAAALRAAGFAHVDAVVTSPDAEPAAVEFARSIGGK